jgi:hypothetical protein
LRGENSIRHNAISDCHAVGRSAMPFMNFNFLKGIARRISLSQIVLIFLATLSANAAEPPTIPVGLDAYRQWERWPYQRIGARAYMRSTYDRSGGNEGADASHFLYQLGDDNNVTLDVQEPGVLYFARYNHWHGSPWRYVVDGTEHIVQESSTATPDSPVANSLFMPTNIFPSPLAVTWSTTKGADLSWLPISFEQSFRMGYGRTHYGTGYYIYQQYVAGANLSQPIISWDALASPDTNVLALINRAGTNIAPTNVMVQQGVIALLASNEVKSVLFLTNAPSMLRKLTFSVPRSQALGFGRARLRVTWDGRNNPSVDAPVALFFGAGTLYNRANREFLVKAFPVFIRFDTQRVELSCFFPMPFFESAKIELIGAPTESTSDIAWNFGYEPYNDPSSHVGYFHATYRDHPNPQLGQDLVFLDTRETEGGGDWSGSFVGTSWIFSDRAVLSTLEGDPRFFFDDSQSPQAYGTGTEEWGGGGDYWGGQNMTLPFAGHPVGAPSAGAAQNDEDKIESAYRFLLGDLMPFGKNAVIRLEHGGANESTEHYQSVTYWYGAPAASLVKTDELKIADSASETAHNYFSPQASASYQITSRYELGVDSIPIGNGPLANPTNYAEFQFQAEAGKTFYIWVRGENLDGNNTSDATWFQFDQEINTANLGSTYDDPYGFGNWLDAFPKLVYAWSSGRPQDPPQTITFAQNGLHRLRVQPRHSRHYIQQIWLSATQSTLPAQSAVPIAGTNEIVLHATNAINLNGLVKLVTDSATGGKVLEINGVNGNSIAYPTQTDSGRKTIGTSEFTLQLRPDNYGVMLRRKLDYAFPNQRAEVFVATNANPTEVDWQPAGIWYLAGANTCVYSNPGAELGASQHIVQTSNRRFRDDEFLVPRNLTQGHSSIRVRVKFTPSNIPLFPGRTLDEQAWSEIRYDAYCFVLPEWRDPIFTHAVIQNGSFIVTWINGGKLQSTTNLTTPINWSDIGTNGSFTNPVIGAQFFRVVR